MARRPCIAALLAGAAATAGCGERPSVSPPQIHYGQDACAACGMIISDERFAAGLVTGTAGRYQTFAFDDLGCLLDHEAALRDEPVAARYVRDFQAARWREAESAFYVHCTALHSPMAFNLAACGSREDAEALGAERGGEILDFQRVQRRFEEGVLAARQGERR